MKLCVVGDPAPTPQHSSPPRSRSVGQGGTASASIMIVLLSAAVAITSPADFVKGMSIGINLGNVLDAPHEGAWAAPAEEHYFDDYVAAGFKSVRVPVRWDKHTMMSSPWTVNSSFLDRVETVIGWSLARGMHTVLNTHHDDWLDAAATDGVFVQQLVRLAAIWKQIADRFANKSERLLAFEIYNEPHANMTVDWLNRMNAVVLPVIRATNPTRNVLFGGLKWMNPHWIIANPDAMIFPVNDSHVFLEVHSYDPFSFCGSHPSNYTTTWSPRTIDTWADGLASWAAARSMPVLLGEFGCNKTQVSKRDAQTAPVLQLCLNSTPDCPTDRRSTAAAVLRGTSTCARPSRRRGLRRPCGTTLATLPSTTALAAPGTRTCSARSA